MNPNLPSEKRRFAAAYLRCFDAEAAAQTIGRSDGIRMLTTPAVQRELELQRGQCDICRADIVRRLAQLAFGRANDCVKLVLQEAPEVDALDLSLLSEVKRNDKGTVEVKLIDRIRALEQLMTLGTQSTDCAEAFFAAAEDVDAD
ncbi:MAG: terminase small subunit [Faecousia sp.]